ncbi:hypothetical protein [Cyanobacterium sp. Dongsha4]|uniref:hypothetical protein n=1 Tax=Cyanobacterium sp. DS4 TaxID=2878255 RepID=UPI002E80845E|nr:hypothetical protein [Cyanobacterium sp. Dongsha4]WVL00470.1 hypothetical protein Dongsha4_17760 [Cyanobacterium sp. Dongsha4]
MEKVGNGEQGTGNGAGVNIYKEKKLLVHPIIKQRRQRLLIKRKMTKRWFSTGEQGIDNEEKRLQ